MIRQQNFGTLSRTVCYSDSWFRCLFRQYPNYQSTVASASSFVASSFHHVWYMCYGDSCVTASFLGSILRSLRHANHHGNFLFNTISCLLSLTGNLLHRNVLTLLSNLAKLNHHSTMAPVPLTCGLIRGSFRVPCRYELL